MPSGLPPAGLAAGGRVIIAWQQAGCPQPCNARTEPGPYHSDKWVSPAPAPGDALLFPSWLMHAVPPNPGARRITLAFNAIPTRLDSWGYAISFAG